jgi:hypothetical protein
MATLQQKINAERELRAIVDSAELPQPDEIEYGNTCIRAIWWEQKRAVVIDIDEHDGARAGDLDDLHGDLDDLLS